MSPSPYAMEIVHEIAPGVEMLTESVAARNEIFLAMSRKSCISEPWSREVTPFPFTVMERKSGGISEERERGSSGEDAGRV